MTDSDELVELARGLADWSAAATGLTIYLFGSRVRGDHRPDSDIDILIDIKVGSISHKAAVWYTKVHDDGFAAKGFDLPGPIRPLDNMDLQMSELIRRGPVVHIDRNVRCVLLPPKPINVDREATKV